MDIISISYYVFRPCFSRLESVIHNIRYFDHAFQFMAMEEQRLLVQAQRPRQSIVVRYQLGKLYLYREEWQRALDLLKMAAT